MKTPQNPESLYVSRKLLTYPSPNPTFCPKWEVSVKVGLGELWVGNFPETYYDQKSLVLSERNERKP